jgi:hypothetical protein
MVVGGSDGAFFLFFGDNVAAGDCC